MYQLFKTINKYFFKNIYILLFFIFQDNGNQCVLTNSMNMYDKQSSKQLLKNTEASMVCISDHQVMLFDIILSCQLVHLSYSTLVLWCCGTWDFRSSPVQDLERAVVPSLSWTHLTAHFLVTWCILKGFFEDVPI